MTINDDSTFVADLDDLSGFDDWGDGPAAFAPGEAPRGPNDRTPPQDNAAEQSVLGSMLISKDAIGEVTELLKGHDFYRPAHEVIHDAIVDLYGRGEPADPITVAAELQRRGELARVGGAPYLHTLSANVPIAANAGFYAQIVREKAVLRRLVEAGTRIVQMGYAGEGEIDSVVDSAQAEVYKITDRRATEDYVPLSDIMNDVLDEIEAIENREAGLYGVPTGFADLDELTNGLHSGQMIIIAARPAMGKALALDTPLPTPTGWTTMGEVAVGDELYDAHGRPTRVVAATEVLVDRPCFRVSFADGSELVADAEHQWVTESEPGSRIVTTEQLAREPHAHAVINTAPLRGSFDATELPGDPYALGAWLASEGEPVEPEVALYLDALHEDLCQVLGRTSILAAPGLSTACLRAPEPQRRELLAGLLDVSAEVTVGGAVSFACDSGALADGVAELVAGLGYQLRRSIYQGTHVVTFVTADEVFRLHRKQIAHKEARPESTELIGRRQIVAVTPVASVPVRCVQVDNASNPEQLYLAGRSMIPTHNSTLALDLCRAASIHNNLASVFFSLEMTRSEIVMRLLSAEARVPLNHIRNGNMTEEDWDKIARTMPIVSAAPMFIDDSPNMTMMEIRAKARRLKQNHDLRMIVIDYMQLMSSGKKVESRQLEVSEFSRNIKLLAKELEVPIIALSQLNRGPEQRSDKKPMMSDLRESGCVTADTRVLRADTGAEITIGELLASDARDVPVWALDDRLKLVARTMTHAFPSGTKEVFELTLASGRRISATANHPFLTYDGWMPLRELTPGARVGALRHVPSPLELVRREDHEVVTAAADVVTALTCERSQLPDWIASLPKDQLARFVGLVWGCRGEIVYDDRPSRQRISLSSDHRQVLDDLARILLRFNVFSRIERHGSGGRDESWCLVVQSGDNEVRFCESVKLSAGHRVQAERLMKRRARPRSRQEESAPQVWAQVRRVLVEDREPELVGAVLAGGLGACSAPDVQRERLARVAEVLDEADLDVVATNDVFWDSVVSIKPAGVTEVYDATVLGVHNFIANGLPIHNSLEQDADMVILLHREDVYEKESPRLGEADLIVAKHRNGPTRDITVAFQGHYSRFVDMAH